MTDEEWISAYEAHRLVAEATNSRSAGQKIIARAKDGLVVAKATRAVARGSRPNNAILPEKFWQGAEVSQDWDIGDFARSDERGDTIRAYGVSFARSGIMAMIGPALAGKGPPPEQPQRNAGGSPPAAWWDALWIEICRQLYVGDLRPTKQSDIEKAMMDFLALGGVSPAVSTIRLRANKLWVALNRKDEN